MTDADLPASIAKKAKKNKAAGLDEAAVQALVEKAVTASTASLTARAEAAEAKLAEISKTVVPGGPRPMGFPQSPNDEVKAELNARLLKYKRMADEAQDNSLSQGYDDLAKKVEAQISKLA
jgi:hypothetical protein